MGSNRWEFDAEEKRWFVENWSRVTGQLKASSKSLNRIKLKPAKNDLSRTNINLSIFASSWPAVVERLKNSKADLGKIEIKGEKRW